MLLAELSLQTRAARSGVPSIRPAAYAISIFANNVPDLDFIYMGITSGELGYLLHHRGHTHTLALGVPLGLACAMAWLAVTRRRSSAFSQAQRQLLLVLGALGPLCHLAMDFSNNYGVHPFWPVWNGWLFGDAVYIIEPWFWATAIPPLIIAAERRLTKAALTLLLLAAIGAAAFSGLVPLALVVALAVCAVASALVSARLRAFPRALLAAGSSLFVAAGFFAASTAARSRVGDAVSRVYPRATTHDVVLTPSPANPFCFTAILLQTEGERYVARRAAITLLPRWLPASRCSASDGEGNAPLTRAMTPAADFVDAVSFRDEYSGALVELRGLQSDCQTAAFLRWARAPFWTAELVGDLRYDRSPELDFSEMPRRAVEDCPVFVPPWVPPTGALLRH
jgi:inner membrane protein